MRPQMERNDGKAKSDPALGPMKHHPHELEAKKSVEHTITASFDKDLNYLSVSLTIGSLSGHTAAEFAGKNLRSFSFLPEQHELLVEKVEQAFKERTIQEFHFILDANGDRFFAIAAPQLDNSGNMEAVALVLYSMPSHMSERNFVRLFEQSPAGIIFMAKDGRFLDINPALVNMWGYSKEEIKHLTVMEITHPEDRELSQSGIKQLIEGKVPHFTFEKRYLCKDGHYMWGRVTASTIRDEMGEMIYNLGVVEDITQSRQTEQALDNERLLMQAVMDSTADAIYVKDLEGRFVRVNQGILKKYSYTDPAQILGKTDFDFFPPEMAQEDFDGEKRVAQTGEPVVDLEGIEIWADRPPTWVSTVKVAVRNHEGKIIGTLGISRDITDRKKKEEEIKQLNQSLEKRVSERTKELLLKNKELEEFTYTVSHDLKAPLRGISGYSNLLLQEHSEQLDDDGRNFLGKLIQSADQLSQLIDDLLAYSRMERREVTYSTISIKEIVNTVLEQFKTEIADRRVQVHLDLTAITIQSSHDLLLQIVQNYIENALKFTRKQPNPEIWIEYKEQAEGSLLSVRDNGIGFDDVYSEKIFDVFQRLNQISDYPGTGIGLALAKKAARLLGYRVWGHGEVEKGATFYLQIKDQKHL